MRKTFLITAVASILMSGVNPALANNIKTVTSTLDLKMKRSVWFGDYYMTYLNLTGVNEQQEISGIEDGLIAGQTAKRKVSSKSILAGNKGKLVAVWAGPGDPSAYPYLAAWEGAKKNLAPVKLTGWNIGCLWVADPLDERSTVSGSIKTKVSGGLRVPATDEEVPSNEKKAKGYTQYTFGLPGAILADTSAIRGWGSFTTDFKKLFFSGKVRITGSSDVVEQTPGS